jgi:curli production assembly/transport component CsgG|tara:strand:+ start:144 stop:1427 length:1284 start_codon:yes stop_codon:yes gene_type:complete
MFKKLAIIFLATLFLASCAGKPDFDVRVQKPVAKTFIEIAELDGDPVIIAVYDFMDMTGQKKPGGNFASMSTAVTQGSYQILIKALQDVGDGKWFRVVERASLPSLLQERKLIRSTRQMADGEDAESLPPLLFAGAYITGGIVGYDSDTKSGGIGARILGVQANTKYRQDVVTIILRLVNVQTGEVVISTVIEKTIFSTGKGADIFKYFDADTMLLESEVGMARNEPVTFAVRKAIEAGVAEIIEKGADKELWKIKLPPEPVEPEVVEEVKEEAKVDLTIEQGKPEKIKTRAEYLAEKAAKKKLKEFELAKKKAKAYKLKQENKAKKLALLEEKKAKKELLLAEKKAKKELIKAKKIELADYNMENKTNLKTYSAYLTHLKELEKALKKDAAILLAETQSRKIRKAALEVEDESIIIESNTVTSDND